MTERRLADVKTVPRVAWRKKMFLFGVGADVLVVDEALSICLPLVLPSVVDSSSFPKFDSKDRAEEAIETRPPRHHQIGPAQLLRKRRTPTATTLYPLTPLYALLRSIELIALLPPSAKNETWAMITMLIL